MHSCCQVLAVVALKVVVFPLAAQGAKVRD